MIDDSFLECTGERTVLRRRILAELEGQRCRYDEHIKRLRVKTGWV